MKHNLPSRRRPNLLPYQQLHQTVLISFTLIKIQIKCQSLLRLNSIELLQWGILKEHHPQHYHKTHSNFLMTFESTRPTLDSPRHYNKNIILIKFYFSSHFLILHVHFIVPPTRPKTWPQYEHTPTSTQYDLPRHDTAQISFHRVTVNKF